MKTKLYFQSALLILLLTTSFWWGEAGGGFTLLVRACMVSFAISTAVFLVKLKFLHKLLIYFGLVTMLMCAFLAGQASNQRAFNHCVAHGEDVRADLQAYFKVHQHYPNTIAELGNRTCNRILRPSILSYLTVSDGYQLYFGDEFVAFTANQYQPFEAQK